MGPNGVLTRSTYPTSYEALVGRAEAKAGEWVLVHAGAGGVGLAAIQIAKGEPKASQLSQPNLHHMH